MLFACPNIPYIGSSFLLKKTWSLLSTVSHPTYVRNRDDRYLKGGVYLDLPVSGRF